LHVFCIQEDQFVSSWGLLKITGWMPGISVHITKKESYLHIIVPHISLNICDLQKSPKLGILYKYQVRSLRKLINLKLHVK
jgi:ABC-type cobalamin transport system permease subunit